MLHATLQVLILCQLHINADIVIAEISTKILQASNNQLFRMDDLSIIVQFQRRTIDPVPFVQLIISQTLDTVEDLIYYGLSDILCILEVSVFHTRSSTCCILYCLCIAS